ncbi:DUF1168-domain-containing protein [Phellopilus nigrolimitatus]|nr:DUF1168-domain-containing protein [Phellopilus nigrolimitatus]
MAVSGFGSASPSPGPSSTAVVAPANRHAPTAVEAQRLQLARLLKDPAKPVHIPAPPKEKTIRPAREMMKNVQGSSAGAGSGEFHVYKASRRREYERLKAMDETARKEAATLEFEEKKRQWEESADAKTSKNRAKRLKKKEKKVKGNISGANTSAGGEMESGVSDSRTLGDTPLKKRRLVNGAEMVFRKPGEEGSEDEDEDAVGPIPPDEVQQAGEDAEGTAGGERLLVAVDAPKITIHEDD